MLQFSTLSLKRGCKTSQEIPWRLMPHPGRGDSPRNVLYVVVRIDAQASVPPKIHAYGSDVTPPKQDAPAHEIFIFGNATMKVMVVVYWLIVPIASVACLIVALLAIGDWWLLLVAIGLALIALLAVQQAREYGSTIGRQMRVDETGVSLPEMGILLPWDSMERITQRRDRRRSGGWRYVEFLTDTEDHALLELFAAFNRNVPSAHGPLAMRSAGFVVDMLSEPHRDHPRLINALQRFAPHLMSSER